MLFKFLKKIFLPFWKNGKALLIKRQTNILSAAIVLMVMIFSSGVLGLLRDRLLAGEFFSGGNQWQLDVYFASFRIPDMLFEILVLSALSAAFIPVFSEFLTKDKQKANHFASSVLNVGIFAFMIIALIVFLFARPLSKLITHSLSAKELNLMVKITRLLLISQFFFLLSNFFTGILQSNQRFLLPAFSSVLYNLGIILGTVLLTPIIGIYGPVTGVLVGAFLHFIIQVPVARRLGFHYQWAFNLKHPGIKKLGRLMLPKMFSFAVKQVRLNTIVFLATSLTAGSLTMYNFAQHLNALPVSLFGLTIGQAALPALSKEIKRGKKNFRKLFLSSLLQIFYFSLPVGVILLVLRVPLVRLAFGAKNFPWEATLTTAKVVGVLSVFLAARSATQLSIRTFYALQNTFIPLILRIISVVFSVGLAVVFVFRVQMGVVGLALAEGIGEVIFSLLLFVFLEKELGRLFKKKFLLPLGKMLLAAFLTSVTLWGLMRGLDRFVFNTTRTLNLIFLTAITLVSGCSVYLGFSLLFDIKQLRHLLMVLKRFGRWKEVLAQTGEILEARQPPSLPSEKD